MAIEDRNLTIGTRLVAKYKKQSYICTVEISADGERNEFLLEDGKRFKSPSSAGMAIMGGKAVNGWRFWTVETVGTDAPPAKAEKRKGGKKASLFKKLPDNGLEEGQHRFFCTACQKAFITSEEKPEVCAEGHSATDAELTAAPSAEAVGADKENAVE